MRHIVIATADDVLGGRLLGRLAAAGFNAEFCTTWADTLLRSTRRATGLLLVDATLPGASGPLLAEMGSVLPAAPVIRTVGGALAPLARLREDDLLSLARDTLPPLLDAHEQRLLDLAGLGGEPLATLQTAARNQMPVVIQGERGTGKEWVARLLHRISGATGPFVPREAGEELAVHGPRPGTLYIENVDLMGATALVDVERFAQATDWRLVGGTRDRPGQALSRWAQLRLKPLRERPRDIRALASLYLDSWSQRLGLPRRRVHHGLWRLIERHTWPGNQRELETFVVQAATSSTGVMISRGSLPHAVLARLDPAARTARDTQAFEHLVEQRLRGVVDRYEPDRDATSLYRMVIDATERALLRLALHRTGGNQKAAAELLGIARNTLRTRLERFEEAP